MFIEYEVVKITRQIGAIPKGALGTILMIYEDDSYYEVEFVDQHGETIDVITVSSSDIEKMD